MKSRPDNLLDLFSLVTTYFGAPGHYRSSHACRLPGKKLDVTNRCYSCDRDRIMEDMDGGRLQS